MALGFQQVGIADTDLTQAQAHLLGWLADGMHGSMNYMEKHGRKRSHPSELVDGTLRVISVRMDYWPTSSDTQAADLHQARQVLNNDRAAYLSRYALGRDYHKILRKRLQQLADQIKQEIGEFGYRAFVDSAPVLEKPLAQKAGLGWTGKHTNLINERHGSWFFLGELYTDLPLPIDNAAINHCGTCHACIDECPTDAIVAPYQLDARRCISYLTIEHRGSIPEALRPLMGNRIYGCDDCQLVCPWNRFAEMSTETAFQPRHRLDDSQLVKLFSWSEAEFLSRTEGSAIRRIGYECWLRNIAIALGNAGNCPEITAALKARADSTLPLVREHVAWALAPHQQAK